MGVDTEQDDSIRGLLEGAVAGTVTADAPPPAPELDAPAPAVETPEQKADRARDEQGRFATAEKARETLTLKPAVLADPKQPIAPAQLEPAKVVPAPTWFKGAGKVDWNKMPEPVRAELSEFVGALEAERAELAPMKELIDTNREFLVNEAGSMPEAFRRLIHLAKVSTTVDGAKAVAQYVLQQRGIDPRQVFGGQPLQLGSQPQQPDLDSLIEQRVNAKLQPFQAQLEQREDQQHLTTIQEFAANPAHPYFNDVRQHMGALLKAGHARTLDEAYEQATWASPVIRPQLIAAQAEETAKTRATEVQKAQQAARASVTGSPTAGAVSAIGESDGSIRGDLLLALSRQAGTV